MSLMHWLSPKGSIIAAGVMSGQVLPENCKASLSINNVQEYSIQMRSSIPDSGDDHAFKFQVKLSREASMAGRKDRDPPIEIDTVNRSSRPSAAHRPAHIWIFLLNSCMPSHDTVRKCSARKSNHSV